MALEISPPEGGSLRIEVPIAPVSHQSTAARKAAVRQAVRSALGAVPYLLTDDVRIRIDWLINPYERYESDAPADVDNILKPIIDALCGPAGILINDCQVQRCDALWRDRFGYQESIEIELEYDPDAWMDKKGLIFLTFGRGLAFPLPTFAPEMVYRSAEHVLRMFGARDEVNARIGNRSGDRLQPIQRVYHVSRVREFTRMTMAELLDRYPPPPES